MVWRAEAGVGGARSCRTLGRAGSLSPTSVRKAGNVGHGSVPSRRDGKPRSSPTEAEKEVRGDGGDGAASFGPGSLGSEFRKE
jgi:hypothetical protein